jgi:probable rRNA maturation factor
MIHIQNEHGYSFDADLLRDAAHAAILQQGAAEDAELSLVLVDDASMQAYNRDYREIDAPTDVLSFPSTEIDLDSGAPYLGDLIVSYPTASAQAAAAGHSLDAELALLVVHGLLHLLGHDHYDDDEKMLMWAAQHEILNSLGISARPTE